MTGQAATVAERGAQAWRRVVHEQLAAEPDHGDFYAIAGELVDTLRSLESLARALSRQVSGYGEGRALRDDAGADPAARLAVAVEELESVRVLVSGAERSANRFWSHIGRIAVEDGPR
jgi:hypothetical protein